MATDGSNATAAVDATAADATAADATAADATAADAAPTIMMPMAMAAAEEDEENSASARQSLQNLKALQRKMARDKYKAKLKHESRSRIDSEAKAASAWLPPSLGSAGLWKIFQLLVSSLTSAFMLIAAFAFGLRLGGFNIAYLFIPR